MDPHVREQVEAMQPRKGALLLLIPAALVGVTIVLYIGTFALGMYGRPADGERVTLVFDACPEAQAVVAHRVEGMGLGEPVFVGTSTGFDLTVTLPADPQVAAAIPATLATPAVLEATPVDAPDRVLLTNAHVRASAIRQDLTLIPWTVLTLTEPGLAALDAFVKEEREGRVVYRLDGEEMGSVSNLKGATPEVEITPSLEDDRARLETAAAWSIVLDSGPLPCPTAVRRAPPG